MLVNIELGIDYCGREDVYKNFIATFIENYKSVIEDITNFSKEDRKRCIHSIKGLSLNLGSLKLYEVSKKQDASLSIKDEISDEFIEVFKCVYNEIKIIYNELK